MLLIAGYVYVPPADIDEFIADAQATYPVGAANPGNHLLSFALHDATAGAVTVLEKWESREALDHHLATPEVTGIFAKWAPRMRNEVRLYDALNERDPRA
ncbi:hypothetical protein GCM10022223_32500 [Kineosporia mesophila]|uniref:ABM domain-containing protein n=1 Tax=Kineosporia mesophila TaxID=566012 RepID=A0ABP6ZLP3_9ACTN|nr:antibiotic biosynthesis monooxygenase [Kineosporia mesophila]MCD5354425.1 antibiotic biosynthesis monooxygenase [Kineosporia mesophila]